MMAYMLNNLRFQLQKGMFGNRVGLERFYVAGSLYHHGGISHQDQTLEKQKLNKCNDISPFNMTVGPEYAEKRCL